jgi:hypothetical protein
MGRKTAFFQRAFKLTYDMSALERLERQATFKSRALWCVKRGKVLKLAASYCFMLMVSVISSRINAEETVIPVQEIVKVPEQYPTDMTTILELIFMCKKIFLFNKVINFDKQLCFD